MDSGDQNVNETAVTFLEPHQRKNGTHEKWWHINKKLFRFKLHFFLMGGALSTVLPFVAVFAKNTLGLSATSFGVVMTFQQFFFTLTKPTIGYITDYFNKLKAVIFVLAIGQGLFLFLLLLISPIQKEITAGNRSIHNNLSTIHACNICHKKNDSNTLKIPVNFNDDFATSKIQGEYLHKNDSRAYRLSNTSQDYKITVPFLCHSFEDINFGIFSETIMTRNIISYVNVSSSSNQSYFEISICTDSSKPSHASSVNKCLICCDIENSCFLIYDAMEENTTMLSKNGISDFQTYQFWLFAFLFVGVNVCINGIYTLSDTALCEGVQKNGGEFGKQRLFSCVGWGIGAVIGGFLTDYTNQYKANFVLFALISIIILWNIYKLDFVKPHISKNILKDVGNTMNSREFLSFQLGTIFMGIGLAFTWFYLLWFVTSIGGNRMVCGLVQTVQSFAGDVPFFFFSGWVLKKIGCFDILSLALMACSIRFIWYSQLQNPWMILPMEWAHGFTYGLFYAAMEYFAKKHSKPGTEATTQSVIFVTFDGLGAGIGNIMAGIGFDYLGGRKTFLCAGIFFGCCSLFTFSCTFFNRKRTAVVQNNNGEDM
ncbi:MFS_1_like domain-containing protein [Nephila pilipes]|uniref:MFS_1_like domain-containing protein n=1 Tax=Nephila pilipes TaxID=299642 RepID=A0A8X6Q968_NEPPI|nr:MFS_1_like domain-containing protein [Nephila pilipes]